MDSVRHRHGTNHASKSSEVDRTSVAARPRTVLGELSTNEQFHHSQSQGSHISKSSKPTDWGQAFRGSSRGHNTHAEETETEFPLDADTVALNLDLDKDDCSTDDDSVESEPDELPLDQEVLRASQFVNDIHRYLRLNEAASPVARGYLLQHPQITADARLILVDWMVEVCQVYNMASETLHLAVGYVDRFLSRIAGLRRSKLQLVGIAALFVATKYEDVCPCEAQDLVFITANTYTIGQLLQMESLILEKLCYSVGTPTAYHFLRLLTSVHVVCTLTENLGLYLTELSLLYMDPFLEYNASVVASAALCLANLTINRSLWPDTLRDFTGYTTDDIMPCVRALHRLHVCFETLPVQVIAIKYNKAKFCRVSSIAPLAELPHL
ncbi:cyclin-A1 [Corythoichthys intestinalis]|uniref:cyclin-A1 n=1 Tax=Corythoichthys intestinalis TaxID=161448 RepID=UPI0025A4DABE|nr:cyclin-A1 [Corythoichthys intestinalis]XP_061801645.1 cyclin-A1-like [Nerophis lumbriciformis]